jgi:hypothetical protein
VAGKVESKREASATALKTSPESRRDANAKTNRVADFRVSEETPRSKNAAIGLVQGNTFHGQALAHGPKPLNQFQQNSNLNSNVNNTVAQQSVPAPPSDSEQQAASQLVVSTPAPSAAPATLGGPLTNQKQELDKVAVAERSTSPMSPPPSSSGAEVARAKPAITNAPQAPANEAYAVSADGSNFTPSGTLAPESARWSINAAGGLQRSMDQGRTWQDVDVNAASARGSAMGLRMAMKSQRPNVMAKEKKDIKEKPIVFRAVSANGPDVWAGGSDSSLFHSNDSGANWVRIVPSWRGMELTGDIMNVQFSDPQHGRIITSAAEIWTTVDAGQSWEKR